MFFEKFKVIIFRQLCSNIIKKNKYWKYFCLENKIIFWIYFEKKNLGLYINYLKYMKNCKGCFIINN